MEIENGYYPLGKRRSTDQCNISPLLTSNMSHWEKLVSMHTFIYTY